MVDMLVLIVAAERAVQKVSLRVVYLVQRKGCMLAAYSDVEKADERVAPLDYELAVW